MNMLKTRPNILLITLLLSSAGNSLYAQQRLEMEGTAIIGNRELPKVLYIVPWKSAERIALTTPPYRSVLDLVPQPVERSSFKRQVRFYQQLYPVSELKP